MENEELTINDWQDNTESIKYIELPMVYQKQENEKGKYVGKDGKRYDILSCHRSESKEYVQVGTETKIDEQGKEIFVPIYESRLVINKGWDSFNSFEEALEFYNLEEIKDEDKGL